MARKIKKIIEQYYIEVGIFLFLCAMMFFSVSTEINGWVNPWYGVDYSIGFSSRLLIGAFLQIICGPVISTKEAYQFVIYSFLICFILLAIIFGYSLKVQEEKKVQLSIMVLGGLYFASPAAISYLWTVENMGRLELYLLLITMSMIVIYLKSKNSIAIVGVFTLLSLLCLAIHQVFLLLFLPIIVVMYIKEVFERQFEKKYVIACVVSILLIVSVGLFFQFGTNIQFHSAESLAQYAQTKTELYVEKGIFEQEYFWEFKRHVTDNMLPDLSYRIRYGVINVLLLSPILAIFIYLWFWAIKYADKKNKIKYSFMLLTNLTFVPAFALLTDWGRWFGAYFTVQFFVFFILAAKKDMYILEALESLAEIIKKYPFIFILLFIYLSSMEKFEGINYMKEAENFYANLYRFKEYILSWNR